MLSPPLETWPARSATLVVVDPQAADYGVLLESALGAMRLQFLCCGRDALRRSQTQRVDLWVIHLTLPDMSGLELCEMLRARLGRPTIYVVGDEYRPEDERAARARGASLFGCKPVEAWWFEPWVDPGRAGREGTGFSTTHP